MGRKAIYDTKNDSIILDLYNKGKSLNEIGRLLNTHHEVIRRRLIKMGIEIRNRVEAMIQFHFNKRHPKEK